jgi:Fe-S-cluster containining protein
MASTKHAGARVRARVGSVADRRPPIADGRPRSCVGCHGTCCRGYFELLQVLPADIRRLANGLGLDEDDFTHEYVSLEPCGWQQVYALHLRPQCPFVNRLGRCRVYAHRPRGCREFKVGGLECLRARAAARDRATSQSGSDRA